jgi:hypothetical protein
VWVIKGDGEQLHLEDRKVSVGQVTTQGVVITDGLSAASAWWRLASANCMPNSRFESGRVNEVLMDISRQFINNPFASGSILLLGIGGIFALLNIGRLEDPAFTIKTAVVITHYPGASAQQVEEEVTLPLENALQQLPYLDNVSSISSNGLSQITVNIASNYHSSELPQIWDELRRVGDAARLFPPGVVPLRER